MHTLRTPCELGARSIRFSLLPLLICLQSAQRIQAQAGPTLREQELVPQASVEPGPTADLAEQDWLAQVSTRLAREEYHYSMLDEGRWSAPNRAQRLRSRVGREGLELFPREFEASGQTAAWQLRLRSLAFGREGDLRPLTECNPSVKGERVELDHGLLVE